MAKSEYEIEPNYVGLSNLGSFSSEQITSNLESSVIEQSLSDVAALVSLGDTNIAVPGRILGKLSAYEEAGASDYVLNTDREGYELVKCLLIICSLLLIIVKITPLLFSKMIFFLRNS